jgi:GTP-binding protein Era
MKYGTISVVGKPNVGKSSLINALLGRASSIVSPKPQTTRNRILATFVNGETTAAIIDTPGYHKAANKLDQYLNNIALNAIKDVDLVIFISDLTKPIDDEETTIIKRIKEKNQKVLLLLNKIDLSNSNAAENKLQALNNLHSFPNHLVISVNNPADVIMVKEEVSKNCKEDVKLFDDTENDNFTITEIVRETAINILKQELPYALNVSLDSKEFDKTKNLFTIKCSLIVEKESQKPIVIGSGGSMIKLIGIQSRQKLHSIFDCDIYLELFVKVERDWRNSDIKLREFGYNK